MNYENKALKDIESKLNETKELLSEVKTSFSKEALKQSLNFSFDELKDELKSFNKSFLNELNNQSKEALKQENKALFLQSKDEFKKEFVSELNVNNLSLEVAKNFLAQNKANLIKASDDELKKAEFSDILEGKKQDLQEESKEALKSLDDELKKVLKDLGLALDDKLIKLNSFLLDEARKLLKLYIVENRTTLFKPFNLSFLKADLLKDKDFKKAFDEVALQVVVSYIKTSSFKDEIENVLLELNKKVSEDFFNSKYLQHQRLINNSILHSISLSSALKELSKSIELVRALENGKDLRVQKVYKVV